MGKQMTNVRSSMTEHHTQIKPAIIFAPENRKLTALEVFACGTQNPRHHTAGPDYNESNSEITDSESEQHPTEHRNQWGADSARVSHVETGSGPPFLRGMTPRHPML